MFSSDFETIVLPCVWLVATLLYERRFFYEAKAAKNEIDHTSKLFCPNVFNLFKVCSQLRIRYTTAVILGLNTLVFSILVGFYLVFDYATVKVSWFSPLVFFGCLACPWIVYLFYFHASFKYSVTLKKIDPEIAGLQEFYFVGYSLLRDTLYVRSSVFLSKLPQLNLTKPHTNKKVALQIANLLVFLVRLSDYSQKNSNKLLNRTFIFESKNSKLNYQEMIQKVDKILSTCEFDVHRFNVKRYIN